MSSPARCIHFSWAGRFGDRPSLVTVAGRIDIVWDSQIDIVAILLDCHALIGFGFRVHRGFCRLMSNRPPNPEQSLLGLVLAGGDILRTPVL